tara:strand:+ start:2522 stop:3295 length:774 start_codon:yes stop_codon:yes gene_type:complete
MNDKCCCSCHKPKYKTGDIILVKNMYHRLQDNGVCPDQLEQFDETLECESCDMKGSFFLTDDKNCFGLCHTCMLENYKETGREEFVKMTEKEIEKYYLERENQCYDLWCHKGHLRNMDKNSYYQDRNGEVCNRNHPYQNPHDEMIGYYRIVDGIRYDYVKDENTDSLNPTPTYREVRWNDLGGGSDCYDMSFEKFISLIEDGTIHHSSYRYPAKYKFTFTVNDMNSEQEAWDFLYRTLDVLSVKDVFDCEKVEDESQ